MVRVPTVRAEVLKNDVVTPPMVVTLTGLPALLPSIWNCTVPVGVFERAAVPRIVPSIPTRRSSDLGLTEELTAVLVLALLTTCPPVKVPLLLAKLLSPP